MNTQLTSEEAVVLETICRKVECSENKLKSGL